jgi:hypothetical protein
MTGLIRASYTKLALKRLRQGRPEAWAKLRQDLGEDALREVRATAALMWLPLELHAAIADAMIDACGRSDARAIWADVMLAGFESTTLGPIVSGALRLYGRDPGSVMRMTGHAWPIIFRGCGRAFTELTGEDRATVKFEQLASAMAGSTGVLDSFMSNCDAALQYTAYTGTITANYDELAHGRFAIDVHWQRTEDPKAG